MGKRRIHQYQANCHDHIKSYGGILMDDVQLKAYKTLLYQALLDIRTLSGDLAWSGEAQPETVVQTSKEIFFIANVFHNLANSVINNLLDYNETDFWNQLDQLNIIYPNTTNYKKLYEQMISEEH